MGFRHKNRIGGVSDLRSDQIHDQIHALVCSDPWHDHCASRIGKGRGRIKPKRDTARELIRLGVYPPADPPPRHGQRRRPTLMRRCVNCGHVFPPQYVAASSRWCEECRANLTGHYGLRFLFDPDEPIVRVTRLVQYGKEKIWTPMEWFEAPEPEPTESPMRAALERLEVTGMELVEPKLQEEKKGVLREQVDRLGRCQTHPHRR